MGRRFLLATMLTGLFLSTSTAGVMAAEKGKEFPTKPSGVRSTST